MPEGYPEKLYFRNGGRTYKTCIWELHSVTDNNHLAALFLGENADLCYSSDAQEEFNRKQLIFNLINSLSRKRETSIC